MICFTAEIEATFVRCLCVFCCEFLTRGGGVATSSELDDGESSGHNKIA